MALDNGRVTGQLDTGLPDPQNDPELTTIATDFKGKPIYDNESYFALDGENYRAEDVAEFVGHYIGELGFDQVAEKLGATEHNTKFNPEGND